MTSIRVVLLSGPLGVGKSTLAKFLIDEQDFAVLAVRRLIEESVGREGLTRKELQEEGAILEHTTSGSWIAQAVGRELTEDVNRIVVDAVRTKAQVEAMRNAREPFLLVHLTASEDECRRRFNSSLGVDTPGEVSFDEAMMGPVERAVFEVAELAGLVLDTTSLSPEKVGSRTVQFLDDSSRADLR